MKLIEEAKIHYKSTNLTDLSRTQLRLSSHANFNGWEVSDIVECAASGYKFTVTAPIDDETFASDDMKTLCSEAVSMTRVTPTSEDPFAQGIYAVTEGVDPEKVLESLLEG